MEDRECLEGNLWHSQDSRFWLALIVCPTAQNVVKSLFGGY